MKKWKNLPLPSLGLAACGLVLSIITALLLPGKIYEYITTAAGILLLINWLFIILSAFRVLKLNGGGKITAAAGIFFLLLAISGTLAETEIRPGFYASFIVMVIIIAIAVFVSRKKKQAPHKPALE